MRISVRARAALCGLSAIAAIPLVAVRAGAQTTPACGSVLPPGVPSILVKGSTAVQPLIRALSKALYGTDPATNMVVLYASGGSCTGVDAIVSDVLVTGTASYWTPATGDSPQSCDLAPVDGGAGIPAGIGVSDVFPQSCTGHENDAPGNGWNDFWGMNQVMTFIVPKAAANVNAISAEAAYLTLGMTNKQVDPWTDKNLIFIRNSSSGTQTMISKAVGLKPNEPKGIDAGGSSGVVSGVKGSANPNATIGIVSTAEADADPTGLKVLAFQPKGQSCAFWPDSTASSLDKRNVRNGTYPIWGPLHLLAKTTGQAPSDPNVKKIIDYFTGAATPPGGPTQLIDLEIDNYTVPQCAMTVERTSELGDPQPFTPDAPCSCYFEARVGKGGAELPSGCKPPAKDMCSSDPDCANNGTNTHCRFGYCEAH